MRNKLTHLAKQPPPLSSQTIKKDDSTKINILAKNDFFEKAQSREATLSSSKPAGRESEQAREVQKIILYQVKRLILLPGASTSFPSLHMRITCGTSQRTSDTGGRITHWR